MSTKQQKCNGCEFSCSVIKVTICRNSKKETTGFICCHQSEKVRANNIFTGKTSPHWCPLKKEAQEIHQRETQDNLEKYSQKIKCIAPLGYVSDNCVSKKTINDCIKCRYCKMEEAQV